MEDGNPPLPPPPIQDSRSIHIMANLKDSLLTHLAKSNPSLSINIDDASSFIQQRLPQLFHSFHTPTHPPYALMIENALKGLNEENGSTEEAISEFIKREYEDLPWAHVKILGVQLKMLCENEELVCNENGRYVFVADGVDGKVTECKGSKKRKKGKKRNNRGKRGKRGRMERCESVERDNELQEEGIDGQIRASKLRDARADEPSRMVVECIQEQLEEEENPNEGSKKRKKGKKKNNREKRGKRGRMERCESVERDNELQEEGVDEQIRVSELRDSRSDEPSRMVVECIQEQLEEAENPLVERVEEQAEGEKGLFEVVGKQSQPECQETRVIEQHVETEAPAQSEVEKSQISQIQDSVLHLETICSSQQTALNLLVDSQQPLLVPISEGLPNCIPSAGIELSITQLQQQMPCNVSSESSLGAPAKMSASLSSLDVCEHKQNENPVSEDPEQQIPKRKYRGRTRKSEPKCIPSAGIELSITQLQQEMPCNVPSASSLGAPAKVSASLSSLDVREHKQDENPVSADPEQQIPKRKYRGRPRKSEPKCIPSAGIELSITQLQQEMTCNVPSESSLGAPAKVPASLSSLDVREHKQDENPVSGDLEQQIPKRKYRGRPRKSEPVANYQGESLLPSVDVIVTAQKANINKIGKRRLSQPEECSIGQGRHCKLHKKAQQIKDQIQPQEQSQCVASFPYSDQNETINSSQATAPNFPVNLTHNFGQQLVVPISEGPPECIISTATKLSPTELQLKISADVDLGTTSKMEASLAYMNVHDEQLQYCSQQNSKGNLDENPASRDPVQKPPKRPRGRPPKLKTDANYPGKLSLPSDDGILNKQNPSINKIEKQYQDGRGSGKGRGRPCKLNQNANHEKLSHKEDLAQLHSRPRGQGRPPKVNPVANKCEKLKQQDQTQVHGQPKRRGRPPKANQTANQCDEELQQEDQAQLHGQPKRRGRPPKANQIANQCEEQSQQENQTPHRGRGRGGKGRGRGLGRPPNLNQIANQYEENLPPQDQAQGLLLQTFQTISMENAIDSLSHLSDANQTYQQLQPQLLQVEGPQQDQGWVQNQDLGQERPPNPMLDANQSHQLLLPPQACKDQVKRRGRPPKPKQG